MFAEPPRIARLTKDDAGRPVPWFVAWVGGKPDFRLAAPGRIAKAHREHRCFICGTQIGGATMAFVVGPMCAVNRISAEPPSHRECAKYAATACPFLVNPQKVRRTGGLDEFPTHDPPGEMLLRNPGVALVWVTRSYSLTTAPGGVLFVMGEPTRTLWFCEGREATRAEIDASIESGMPHLRGMAEAQGLGAVLALDVAVANLAAVLPKET